MSADTWNLVWLDQPGRGFAARGGTVVGVVGPAGPPGGSTIARQASEAIGGHRGVHVDGDGTARIADPTAAGVTLVGISIGAASAGASVTIQTVGEITEGSWAWSPGPVWLGPGGTLTQAAPTSGRLWRLGHVLGARTILINPELIAQLGD